MSMSPTLKMNTSIGSVWLKLISRKLIVSSSASDGPVNINGTPCSLHLTYRMIGKTLLPITMAVYSHPKHELIPGPLAQKASQLILPIAMQWLASQKVLRPA